jgi:hypothetical protein
VSSKTSTFGQSSSRKDDVLYYVQTRAGDTYSEAQVARDLQTILSLGFLTRSDARLRKKLRAAG